jgi:Flp pilus assembly protein TadG
MAAVTSLRARLASSRGTELVELALVTPVLLLMIAGLIDVGFLFNRYAVVTNAAREGARVAAVPGWIEDDVRARVGEYVAAAGIPAGSVATTVTPVVVAAGTRSVNAVRVVVSCPYNYLILGPIAQWVQSNPMPGLTLRAAATMRTEVAAGL